MKFKYRKINRGVFPTYINFYLHSNEEDLWDRAKQLHLNSEAQEIFEKTGYEVAFRLQINEDGSNKVLTINGIDISDKDVSL